PMDMGGEVSGTVSGMMNMAGNIGGALSPIVFGVLVQFGSWEAPFVVAASLLVLGAAIWGFWLDPSVSVVEKKAAELPPGSAAARMRFRSPNLLNHTGQAAIHRRQREWHADRVVRGIARIQPARRCVGGRIVYGHSRARENDECGGKRFIIVGGHGDDLGLL